MRLNNRPIDPESPIYAPSEIEYLFGHSHRVITYWANTGRIPGAFKTPGGHWMIPEHAVITLLVGMRWPKDDVEQILKEYRNSL